MSEENDLLDRGYDCFLSTASFLVCQRNKVSAPEKKENKIDLFYVEASKA